MSSLFTSTKNIAVKKWISAFFADLWFEYEHTFASIFCQ